MAVTIGTVRGSERRLRPAIWYGGWIASACLTTAVVLSALFGFPPEPTPYASASAILESIGFEVVGLSMMGLRPKNPLGALLFAVGLLGGLSLLHSVPNGVVFIVAFLSTSLSVATVVHALLVFPDGRFHARSERVFVIAVYAAFFVLAAARLPLSRTRMLYQCGWLPRCPDNPLAVLADLHIAREAGYVTVAVRGGLAVVFAALLIRRVIDGDAAARRGYAPVLAVMGVLVGDYLATTVLVFVRFPGVPVFPALDYAYSLGVAVLPFAVAYGLQRARPSLAELVTRLERCPPERIEEELSAVLNDPSLRLTVRGPDGGLVDLAGGPVDEAALNGRDRASTAVDADVMLLHDPFLQTDPTVLEAAITAARLSLANGRLKAEMDDRLQEVSQSRARIDQAAVEERHRIERDLHDGAQQQLLAVGMSIQEARAQLPVGASSAQALEEAAAQVLATLAELRDLAQGLRPALLAERGLSGAVPALARKVPLEVYLDVDVPMRLPERVEATAYFVVCEALQNATKHAKTTRVQVDIAARAGWLRVCVADNGVGGPINTGAPACAGLPTVWPP